MVCFRYISVNTLHKGDDDDDDENSESAGNFVSPYLFGLAIGNGKYGSKGGKT
jgi:hypothetical protein